jgi:hypothetical protein
MWRTLQIGLFVLGLLLTYSGDKLSIPFLFYSGIACLGLGSMAVGGEAIVTRYIALGIWRHGNLQTYTGIPAILQGVQFNLIGLFLIGVAIMMYLRANGREFFLQMVRHPGLLLVVLGALLLIQAVIILIGYQEQRAGPQWNVILELAISRLLPGLILVALGVGVLGLGLFEIAAPDAFDAMGGGFLETLYGLR